MRNEVCRLTRKNVFMLLLLLLCTSRLRLWRIIIFYLFIIHAYRLFVMIMYVMGLLEIFLLIFYQVHRHLFPSIIVRNMRFVLICVGKLENNFVVLLGRGISDWLQCDDHGDQIIIYCIYIGFFFPLMFLL